MIFVAFRRFQNIWFQRHTKPGSNVSFMSSDPVWMSLEKTPWWPLPPNIPNPLEWARKQKNRWKSVTLKIGGRRFSPKDPIWSLGFAWNSMPGQKFQTYSALYSNKIVMNPMVQSLRKVTNKNTSKYIFGLLSSWARLFLFIANPNTHSYLIETPWNLGASLISWV